MRVNLTDAIKQLNLKISELERRKVEEIRAIEARYEEELAKYKTALEAVEKLNEACVHCGGRGEISVRDEYGYYGVTSCSACKGSGYKKEENDG